jgi:hypothetical protein
MSAVETRPVTVAEMKDALRSFYWLDGMPAKAREGIIRDRESRDDMLIPASMNVCCIVVSRLGLDRTEYAAMLHRRPVGEVYRFYLKARDIDSAAGRFRYLEKWSAKHEAVTP